jgi:hypothetical protein
VKEIKKLPSYYDQNLFIAAGSNNESKHVQKVNKDGYVLKILNKTESLQPDNIGKILFFYYHPMQRKLVG